MADKTAFYPLGSSSAILQQQEQQLRQYTLAALSARDRERVRASPEPHLEIMRPVSPFQNKRPLAHQIAQSQDAQSQRQRDQRIWNPHYQTHSSTQPNTRVRPSHAQETTYPTKAGNSPASRSGTRAKVNTYREDQRGTRGAQRDADISPALRMIIYDTNRTSNSSEQSQRQNGSGALNASGMLAPPDTGDLSRSTSPEGGVKRRNPGWRKPVPKYIPTPPSTPPTATFERVPSMRDKEEQVPPVPPPPSSNHGQNVQPNRLHPGPVRSQTAPTSTPHQQVTPARPARAATDLQVPVMFRDYASAAKARLGSIQPPAQAHTRQTGMSGLSRPTNHSRNLTRTVPLSRTESSNRAQAQVLAAPRAPPQAHTPLHDRAGAVAAVKPSRPPSPERGRDQSSAQQSTLAHPQPRKVPSMAQLVAMVMPTRSRSRSPSRTPSPGVHLTTADISGPIPLNATSTENDPKPKMPETLQAALPSVSVEPPTPIAIAQISKAKTLTGGLLRPEQVQLPPSENSSVKSSPAASPQPSPRVVPAPLPTRPRSPTPAIIPQYPPPPPPFPAPPPNTPVAVPKPRMSGLLQPLLSSKLAEKIESATAIQAEEVRVQPEPVARAPIEERVIEVAAKNYSSSEHSTPPTRSPRKKQVPPEQIAADSSKDQVPVSRQTDDSRIRSGQWSMMITERRSPSPIHNDTTATSQVAGPAAINVTPVGARIMELPPVSSSREHASSSRPLNLEVTRPNVKEVESVANENTGVSPPPRSKTVPPQELGQARTHVSETVISVRKEEPSLKPPVELKLKLSEPATTATVPNAQAPPRPRPVPVPMHDHAQVSRESGLVTPPDTPPGTVVSKPNILDEGGWSKKHDHGYAAQKLEPDVKEVLRSQSAEPALEVKPVVSRALMRRKTLIQDEQPSWNDRTVKESKNISHPAAPSPSTDRPATTVVSTYTAQQEVITPPLPADWKATITNVTRSNINASPSPPILSVEEANKMANVLPHTEPMEHATNADSADMATSNKYVIRGVSTEQVQHATMELEFHVHEVETGRVFGTPEPTERKNLVADKGNHMLPSRSPSPEVTDLDPSSTASLNVKREQARDFLLESNALRAAAAEERVRSRSPVPHRKATQKSSTETSLAQERTDESSIATTTAEETVVSDSTSVESPVRRPIELYSRTNSSSLRRKGRTTRKRADPETRGTAPGRSAERASDNEAHHRKAEIPPAREVPLVLAEAEPLPKPSSPPQRYQRLGSAKRLPLNGSETSLTQPRPKESGREGLSSPQVAARSLPPSAQSQPPVRPPRHPHGQHKRLPAPEVTQAYRPPTPPIPSHYKKKNSNDVLPVEPPTFMKPAVHVIYPDTSTSHGHSLSGDSMLNFKPTNNVNRGQANPIINPQSHRDEQTRPQSPSLTIPTIDDDDGVVVDAYPQVPPKGRRHEASTNVTPSLAPSDFTIQHATRGQVRYPSAPVGQARAHILTLPPSDNSSRSRENIDGSFRSDPRSRNVPQPRANKAARSHSEKVLRKHENVHPVARSRSTPIPSSRQRNRRGFWRIFGVWARVFMSKFRAWKAATPSVSQSSECGGYYDAY